MNNNEVTQITHANDRGNLLENLRGIEALMGAMNTLCTVANRQAFISQRWDIRLAAEAAVRAAAPATTTRRRRTSTRVETGACHSRFNRMTGEVEFD